MIVRQGSGGLATVVAALLIAASVIYAINVWSTTKKETAPGRNLERGIERLKEAAGLPSRGVSSSAQSNVS